MAERTQWSILAGLLVATALFALLLSPDGGRSDLDPRPSTYRATPSGTLALYLLLEELAVPVEQRVTPLVEGAPLPDALAVLGPTEPFSPAEVAALVEWVREGGRLLYAAVPGDTLTAALGLVLEYAPADTLPGDPPPVTAFPAQHPLTTGTDSVTGFDFVFADSSAALDAAGADPLLRLQDGRVAAVALTVGQGTVFAWSDVAPLANQALEESGAAVLFARAAREAVSGDGGPLQFDEYHHGFTGGGSPAGALLSFLRSSAAGRMSLQLAIVAAGLLLLLGSRFGAPIPPAPARRRSPLEHLDALASAYHAGRSRGRARHLVVAGLARRIGRRPPAAGAERDFLTLLASAGHAGRRDAADALLAAWEGSGDGEQLTTLARRADDLVTERTTT